MREAAPLWPATTTWIQLVTVVPAADRQTGLARHKSQGRQQHTDKDSCSHLKQALEATQQYPGTLCRQMPGWRQPPAGQP